MIAPRRRQLEWGTLQLVLLLDRLVRVSPVRLLDQRGYVAEFVEHGFDTVYGPRRQVPVDRQETHRALRIQRDEVQFAVGLVAHQRVRRRHERAGQRLHAATAARLEAFSRQQQSVDAIVVLTDIKREEGAAVFVGQRLLEFQRNGPRRTVRIAEWIREHESGMLAELRRDGPHGQGPAHAPCFGGGAEKVLQFHLSEMGARLQPAAFGAFAHRFRGTPLENGRADSKTIGLVLLDTERRASQSAKPIIVLNQVYVRVVLAGGRLPAGGEIPIEQSVCGQLDAPVQHLVSTGVCYPQFEWRAANGAEVTLAHDAEQVHVFAWTIQAAVGVDRSLQTIGMVGRRMFSAGIEPGPGESTSVTPVRHEGRIVAVANHEHGGFLVPLEVLRRIEPGVPLRVGAP